MIVIVGVIISVWLLTFVARFFRRLTQRGLNRTDNVSLLLKSFIATAVFWAVFTLGTFVVLGLFGVNVTPLFAIFGGLSFILGFALQETLGSFASGLMIMIYRPFDVDDYVAVAGVDSVIV